MGRLDRRLASKIAVVAVADILRQEPRIRGNSVGVELVNGEAPVSRVRSDLADPGVSAFSRLEAEIRKRHTIDVDDHSDDVARAVGLHRAFPIALFRGRLGNEHQPHSGAVEKTQIAEAIKLP